MRKLLYKLGFHVWAISAYGLHADGYEARHCVHCHRRRMFPVNWQPITKRKSLKGENHD